MLQRVKRKSPKYMQQKSKVYAKRIFKKVDFEKSRQTTTKAWKFTQYAKSSGWNNVVWIELQEF